MSWAFIGEAGLFGEIRDFLKSAHEIDERQAQESKSEEDDLKYKADIGQKWAKTEEKYEKADDDERLERGRSLAEIRHGLQKKYDETAITQALKENEDEFAHWPHPEGKRFTLAQHLESNHYAQDFIPGVG
jgi:ribosome-binding ATPase YchF (GTP1/OBG family)